MIINVTNNYNKFGNIFFNVIITINHNHIMTIIDNVIIIILRLPTK